MLSTSVVKQAQSHQHIIDVPENCHVADLGQLVMTVHGGIYLPLAVWNFLITRMSCREHVPDEVEYHSRTDSTIAYTLAPGPCEHQSESQNRSSNSSRCRLE